MSGLLDIFEAILAPPEKSSRRGAQQRKGSVQLPSLEPLPEPGSGGIGDVMHSVVQIVAMREGFMGGMTSAWTGSGTIVHPQGIVLTNCSSGYLNHRKVGSCSSPELLW